MMRITWWHILVSSGSVLLSLMRSSWLGCARATWEGVGFGDFVMGWDEGGGYVAVWELV